MHKNTILFYLYFNFNLNIDETNERGFSPMAIPMGPRQRSSIEQA
jgi:hypothetical protein